jgi:hypothetical protein
LTDKKNQLIDRLVENKSLSSVFSIMIITCEGREGEVYLALPD